MFLATPGDIWNAIMTGSFEFVKPEALFLIAPALLILIFVLLKSFVAIDKRRLNDAVWIKSRRNYRILMFISRTLIFTLLLLALAEPFGRVEDEIPGDITVTMLVDQSGSMDLFDTSFVKSLQENLENYLPVKMAYIGSAKDSDIGDGILDSLEKNKNILLISDGQATSGTRLIDVLLFAAGLNSSISAISLEEAHDDLGVSIKGPSKTISGVENFYKVSVNKVIREDSADPETRLVIGIDNDIVLDQPLDKEEYFFSRNFSDGYHRITARIIPSGGEDHFSSNNVFFKTTHIIPKPKVLLVTRASSALETILRELYDLTVVRTLPQEKDELEKFYAVIINDVPIDELGDVSALNEFVIEGNGLLTVGGYYSFDNGGYKGSALESLLPVTVGKGERQKGDSNIVLVLDVSGSFTETGVSTTGLSTSKALAYNVINDINEKNLVGVVAFDQWPYLVAELEPLFVSKASTLDKIKRLQGKGGQTDFSAGLKGAFNILRGKTGSKNVIFISDGYTWSDLLRQETLDVANAMKAYGIRMYVIGTGRNLDQQFLKSLASTGGGIYFDADTSNRLQIIFGEPEHKEVGTAFSLFTVDPYHFITEDLDIDAVLYGYNQVVPKASAQMLMTTDSGEPAVTVWRHGIGRSVALTVFSSGNNLGELLDRDNSKAITRIVNWAIGDPERKNDFFVDIDDARVNMTAEFTVKSNTVPKVKGLEFSKIDKDTYRAFHTNPTTGFKSVLGAIYGVNYEKEFQYTGFNQELSGLVSATKGKMFTPDQVEQIVEHVKSVSKRVVIEERSFRNTFLLAALILLVLEIVIRRVRDTWFRKKR